MINTLALFADKIGGSQNDKLRQLYKVKTLNKAEEFSFESALS